MIFLDFEASSINGYPLQVGFCVVNADRSRRSAAKLIRHDEWLADSAAWDGQAEHLHKITRAQLVAEGESPLDVMIWLNRELGDMAACVDSHRDTLWLRQLADAAGVEPSFRLEYIDEAFSGPEIGAIADDQEADQLAPHKHRADKDAEHLAVRYILSLRPDAPVHRLYLDGSVERRPLR